MLLNNFLHGDFTMEIIENEPICAIIIYVKTAIGISLIIIFFIISNLLI